MWTIIHFFPKQSHSRAQSSTLRLFWHVFSSITTCILFFMPLNDLHDIEPSDTYWYPERPSCSGPDASGLSAFADFSFTCQLQTLPGTAKRKSWSFVYSGCGNSGMGTDNSVPAVPAARDSCVTSFSSGAPTRCTNPTHPNKNVSVLQCLGTSRITTIFQLLSPVSVDSYRFCLSRDSHYILLLALSFCFSR